MIVKNIYTIIQAEAVHFARFPFLEGYGSWLTWFFDQSKNLTKDHISLLKSFSNRQLKFISKKKPNRVYVNYCYVLSTFHKAPDRALVVLYTKVVYNTG